jgi:hypothetical protein
MNGNIFNGNIITGRLSRLNSLGLLRTTGPFTYRDLQSRGTVSFSHLYIVPDFAVGNQYCKVSAPNNLFSDKPTG